VVSQCSLDEGYCQTLPLSQAVHRKLYQIYFSDRDRHYMKKTTNRFILSKNSLQCTVNKLNFFKKKIAITDPFSKERQCSSRRLFGYMQ